MIKNQEIKSQMQNIILIGTDPVIFMKLSSIINSFDKYLEFSTSENKIKESIKILSKLVELIKSAEPV